MLPYFNFTHPDIAKKLVTYRYLGLDGAHKKRKAMAMKARNIRGKRRILLTEKSLLFGVQRIS